LKVRKASGAKMNTRTRRFNKPVGALETRSKKKRGRIQAESQSGGMAARRDT